VRAGSRLRAPSRPPPLDAVGPACRRRRVVPTRVKTKYRRVGFVRVSRRALSSVSQSSGARWRAEEDRDHARVSRTDGVLVEETDDGFYHTVTRKTRLAVRTCPEIGAAQSRTLINNNITMLNIRSKIC